MTHRQYVAWHAWMNLEQSRPSRSDHYLMQVAQYLDNILHMFDKMWKGKALSEYTVPFGGSKVKAPEWKPGKVPVSEGEWLPHPLSKEEVERARREMMTSRFAGSRLR